MSYFKENIRYICDTMSEVRGSRYSQRELADLFGVSTLSVHGWLSKERQPHHTSLISIVKNTKEILGWECTINDLKNVRMRDTFSLTKTAQHKQTIFEQRFIKNKINFKEMCQRLKNIRKERGLALSHVSELIRKRFTSEFFISPSHLAALEKGKLKNANLNAIIALSVIYDVSIDYIIFNRRFPEKISIDRDNQLLIIPLDKKFLKLPDRRISDYVAKIYKMLHEQSV